MGQAILLEIKEWILGNIGLAFLLFFTACLGILIAANIDCDLLALSAAMQIIIYGAVKYNEFLRTPEALIRRGLAALVITIPALAAFYWGYHLLSLIPISIALFTASAVYDLAPSYWLSRLRNYWLSKV